jgi:hypothetical protein
MQTSGTESDVAQADGRQRRLLTSRVTRTLYYLAILAGLVLLYGRGELSSSGFIYQAF